MSALDYVDGLIDRTVPFALFRAAMHQQELVVSLGWDKTLDKLEPYVTSNKTSSQYADGLEAVYRSLTLYGNKVVKIFKVKRQVLNKLVPIMKKSFVKSPSYYSKRFPLPLEQHDLEKASIDLECVDAWDDDGNENFIVCSTRFITEREKLPDQSLKAAVVRDYGEFDEIYGLRNRAAQFFDIICINAADETIELRLDGIDVLRMADIEGRIRMLEILIKKLADKHLSISNILSSPVNFFPAIKKLYDNQDGIIGEIEHATTTAGIHRGRTRGRQHDVRQDTYHKEGAKGVASLNAYMISKCWQSPTKYGNVELVIPGKLSIASSATPTVNLVYLLSCASEADYNFAMNKLRGAL